MTKQTSMFPVSPRCRDNSRKFGGDEVSRHLKLLCAYMEERLMQTTQYDPNGVVIIVDIPPSLL
jgi:hypothetical protein